MLLERSGDGQTATVLGAGDAPLASCDDAGRVVGADGSPLLSATFSFERGQRSRPGEARVDVAGADGTAVGGLTVRRYTVTPFSKRLTLALLAADGAEVGELAPADKKGRELVVTCGGSEAVRLELADRDRSLRRTVERYTLTAAAKPAPPADMLAAAAVLRYGKIFSELSARANR